MIPRFATLTLVALLLIAPAALGKASHEYWPKITGKNKQVKGKGSVTWEGTRRADKLLGHHGSDTLRGRAGSDVLWGDWNPKNQPTSQRDRLYGGDGGDFIYGSHGRNVIFGGAGNDVIQAHYGRGTIDCGSGNDIYHVPRSLKGKYKVKNCEKVDRRSERQRGGGLAPLP